MRFLFLALALAGCLGDADPVSGPAVTSGVIRQVKLLTIGPNLTLEAHCFDRAPLDVDPAMPGAQLDCASWIEHDFADGRTEEAFGPCATDSTTERCYRIEYHPEICWFGSGDEVRFVHPITDREALVSKAIVECVVR